MHYYEIALLSSPLLLTYCSQEVVKEGDIVEVDVKGRLQKGVVLQEVAKPSFECKEIEATTPFFYSAWQLEVAKFIATYYVCSRGEALGLFTPFTTLQKPQWQECRFTKHIELSPLQQEALHFLQEHSPALLFGQTGSGKTEVYIAFMQQLLQQQKRTILLMPEISLTPQMQKRLEAVFGDAVIIWHSKLTKKQKEKNLTKIYSGEAKIVAGPRSALFLPLQNLGAIIVDEEHDESYKSLSSPKINAKDVAIYIGKKLGISVVLGSATPSVSSYYKFESFYLPSFYKTKKHFTFEAQSGVSEKIVRAIEEVLGKKKQAIVFLPTRAHFKYLICQDCAQPVKCPYCDVGMSVHFEKKALVCHYCNFSEFIPQKCPNCASANLSAKRLGTSEVVNTLRNLFPKAVIEKFDKDVITSQKRLEDTIERFSKKQIDILVGTQMLSKGHDYADVALSVILDIDYVLAQADYRARERAVALMVQIAGRAGRKEDASVIVQTKNREFFERYLDYERFLQDELQLRKDYYPPFVKLAQLLFAHKNDRVAKSAMQEVVECLENFSEIEIVGYGKSAIEMIAGKHRYHILLRSKSAKKLLEAIYACKNGVCDVDIDPINFV